MGIDGLVVSFTVHYGLIPFRFLVFLGGNNPQLPPVPVPFPFESTSSVFCYSSSFAPFYHTLSVFVPDIG